MNTSRMAAALLAVSLAVPAHAAVIGFTGPYGSSGWTSTVVGNLGAAGGSTSLVPTLLTITGGNAASPDPANFAPACTGAVAGIPGACEVRFVTSTIMAPFVFDWTYVSGDSAGAGDDLFGLLVDGVRTQLSDPGGALSQSGHVSVSARTSFGWYLNCTDCIEGAAVARIANFQAGAVPEPATIALVAAGLAGAALRRGRRR